MISKTSLFSFLIFLALSSSAQVKLATQELPLLVIGASYSNASTPFNGSLAPLGGVSVGFGSYLSLGNALIKDSRLSGFVINEGQAGATTFARTWCSPGSLSCGPMGWDSYQTMLDKALARVALPPNFNQYNAKYVVITTPNDCLHSDAFGLPQSQTTPCTVAQLDQVADRLIAVGQSVIALGLIPIFDIPAKYQDLDLNLFKTLFGLSWVIDENSYNRLRNNIKTKLAAALPQAKVLDIWKKFTHIGDGIHPNPETAKKAARIIAQEIKQN